MQSRIDLFADLHALVVFFKVVCWYALRSNPEIIHLIDDAVEFYKDTSFCCNFMKLLR